MRASELKNILKYLLNNRTIINTENLHNKNGDVKLKLSKRKRNFKILWVLDQFKTQNVLFRNMKTLLIERQNMFRNINKERFVKLINNGRATFFPITRIEGQSQTLSKLNF